MANETELERMLVRLVGDGSEYQKMLQDAQTQTKVASANIESATKRIESLSGGLQSFASNALSLLATFGVATSLQGAFDAFAKMERGTIRLEAAIKFNGQTVESVMPVYDEFAAKMSAVTLTGKGAIKGMLQQAEAAGFSGEKAMDLVKSAIALGGATGQSAEGMMRVAKMIAQGHPEFAKRILGLRGIKSNSELVDAINRKMAMGLEVAQAEAGSTSGQLELLGRSLKSLSVDLGGMIATVVRPVVEWLREAVDWFKSLDPAVKQATTVMIGMFAAMVSFGPVMKLLGPLVGILIGPFKMVASAVAYVLPFFFSFAKIGAVLGFGLVILKGVLLAIAAMFGPIGAIVVLLVGLFAYWTKGAGSFSEVWDMLKEKSYNAWLYVKDYTKQFIQWAYPIWNAMKSFFGTLWETLQDLGEVTWEYIKIGAQATWDFITDMWGKIAGSAEMDWDKVRRYIQIAFIAGEFALKNFWDVWDLLNARVAMNAYRIRAEFAHLFTVQLPIILFWIKDQWIEVFTAMFSFVTDGHRIMVENIAAILSNLPGIIAGRVKIDDIVEPVTKRLLEVVKKTAPDMPKRIMDDVEKQLNKDAERIQDRVGDNWESFKKKRLEDFAQIPGAEDKAKKKGEKIASEMTKGAEKELKKFDAVLSGSAEAMFRLSEYAERLKGKGEAGKPSEGLTGGLGVPGAPGGGSGGGLIAPGGISIGGIGFGTPFGGTGGTAPPVVGGGGGGTTPGKANLGDLYDQLVDVNGWLAALYNRPRGTLPGVGLTP